MPHVFAYGSNMCTERIRARAASAVPVATGYVARRRLVFHKRGQDGSAKADAVGTDYESDRVWGVVFSLDDQDLLRLDKCEVAYHTEPIVVIGPHGSLAANIYVADAIAIDASLKPFAWYHRLVVHGAIQHALPTAYVEHLQTFESIADTDALRHELHAKLLVCSTANRSV